MWPWGHLAVGYLLYAALVRYRGGVAPAAGPVLGLAVGTQAPDLVDKPLAWYLSVLPGGRSLAHSLFAVGLVVVAVAVVRARGGTGVWAAFSVGYVSHPLADALYPVVTGDIADLAFLAWPLVGLPTYDGPVGVSLVQQLSLTPFFAFELVVTLGAVALWIRHGMPALAAVRGWIWRRGSVG